MPTHKHAATITALANSIADKSLTIDHLATITREAAQGQSTNSVLGCLLELQPHIDTLKAMVDAAILLGRDRG